MLVVDASVAVDASFGRLNMSRLGRLTAPPLLWPESRSVIHELGWRRQVSPAQATAAHEALADLPILETAHPDLGREAWRIADELGWAKTYDAEYVALASLLGCRLITLDDRLRRGAARLGFVVGPLEL